MTEPLRFRDTGQKIYDFGHSFWVHCPQCDRRSTIVQFGENSPNAYRIFDHHRLTCPSCGYSKDWKRNSVTINSDRAEYFDLALWLQIPCCGQILWAYNAEHLDFLENYVIAKFKRAIARPKLELEK